MTSMRRAEFEYEIPLSDAEEMIALCPLPALEKTRYTIEYEGRQWVVDEYEGANSGLTVAEIELAAEEDDFEKPPWVGAEVSDDDRYLSVSLYFKPFSVWE